VADIGWLVCLWLMVPMVILIVGAPVALLIRLVVASSTDSAVLSEGR
jgi:hypothetical protein